MMTLSPRELTLGFGVIVYVTVPFPLPGLPDVILTQEGAYSTVQGQPDAVITLTLPDPPLPVEAWFGGFRT